MRPFSVDYTGGKKAPFAGPCTIRNALLKHLDITTPPTKYQLQALVEFCKEESEREELAMLASNKTEESKVREDVNS